MPITEHQLHPITLRIDPNHPNPRINLDRQPLQTKRPALGTGTLATQLSVAQPLFTPIGPAEPQLSCALRIANRQRIHCNCPKAMRTALRTSGSPSSRAACNTAMAP